jgi:hypothetical protein
MSSAYITKDIDIDLDDCDYVISRVPLKDAEDFVEHLAQLYQVPLDRAHPSGNPSEDDPRPIVEYLVKMAESSPYQATRIFEAMAGTVLERLVRNAGGVR